MQPVRPIFRTVNAATCSEIASRGIIHFRNHDLRSNASSVLGTGSFSGSGCGGTISGTTSSSLRPKKSWCDGVSCLGPASYLLGITERKSQSFKGNERLHEAMTDLH